MAHPALIDDFLEDIMQGIAEGKTLHQILRGTGLTVDNFYHRLKKNPELKQRYAELQQVAAQVRADQIDTEMDEWAHEDKASSAIRLARAKRWHPGYRDKVEVNQTVEQRDTELSPQVLRMLERVKAQLEGVIDDDGDQPEGDPPGALPDPSGAAA